MNYNALSRSSIKDLPVKELLGRSVTIVLDSQPVNGHIRAIAATGAEIVIDPAQLYQTPGVGRTSITRWAVWNEISICAGN